MKVYLVKAGEWESDVRCVCTTSELAEQKRKEIAEEYGFSGDNQDEWDEFIYSTPMDLIES